MQGAVDGIGQAHIGGNREENVRCLHRDFKFVEIMVLQQLDMVKRAFNQRLRARLAIFFEQVFFQAACVHADPDRAAIGFGGVDNFLHTFGRTDIAGVDPQACRARVRRLQRAFVMKMNVGDDGYIGRTDNLFQRRRALHIGAGYANDIDACILTPADLVDRGRSIAG